MRRGGSDRQISIFLKFILGRDGRHGGRGNLRRPIRMILNLAVAPYASDNVQHSRRVSVKRLRYHFGNDCGEGADK
jgi:hypothetical protein